MKDKILVLGQQYTMTYSEELEDKDGICDKTTKEIEICKTLFEPSKPGQIKNMKVYAHKVMRHEIVHAMMFESANESNSALHTEQVVDWIAIMYPKLKKLFKQLEIEGD